MNDRQKNFFNFIMERVELKNQNKAKELLYESFAKQDEGTFNQEHMMSFVPKITEIIKPEYIDEVKNIMSKHKA